MCAACHVSHLRSHVDQLSELPDQLHAEEGVVGDHLGQVSPREVVVVASKDGDGDDQVGGYGPQVVEQLHRHFQGQGPVSKVDLGPGQGGKRVSESHLLRGARVLTGTTNHIFTI